MTIKERRIIVPETAQKIAVLCYTCLKEKGQGDVFFEHGNAQTMAFLLMQGAQAAVDHDKLQPTHNIIIYKCLSNPPQADPVPT